MFASAEINSLTQPITDTFLFGQLSGSDAGTPPLAQQRLILPTSTQINTWDGAVSIRWIVEPPAPGTKTFNFVISPRGKVILSQSVQEVSMGSHVKQTSSDLLNLKGGNCAVKKLSEKDNQKVIEALRKKDNGEISKKELIEKLKSIYKMK